ncbi:DUF4221 family protein [Mongoliitalea lutea]|uniref:DUF4221 family protein n=1 Tax=Mongoliitalea lutea TaxID=849756 RepID=UPI00167AACDC|nr:DUF4221 family protein [Mongoliitalea lutea]
MDIDFIDKSVENGHFLLALDTLGNLGSFHYATFSRFDTLHFVTWNESSHSLDFYNLEKGLFSHRIFVESDGPLGLSDIEAMMYGDNSIILFDGNARKALVVGLDGSVKALNFRQMEFYDGRSPLDLYYSFASEFGAKPTWKNGQIYFPITKNVNFESLQYYQNPPVGQYDIQSNSGVRSFGAWDRVYLQKDGYFGFLGEISLSEHSEGVALSFPMSPRVTLFDTEGNFQKELWIATSDFPAMSKGLSRSNDDLQKERNLGIIEPWFLKTMYHPDLNALIRFQKKPQALKKADGTLNTNLFGNWLLLVSKAETNYSVLEVYEIDAKDLFLPISFPYKNGILIKNKTDEEEDKASFTFFKMG